MRIIVAVSKSWGIGKDNKLLFSLKEDMKFFKKTTTGKVVIMGKNTYLSLPKRPLKDRVNIVMSSSGFDGECISVKNMGELFEALREYDTNDVYVIGGASMYRQMLPYCDTALITKVDADAEADTYFENLDLLPEWELVREERAEDAHPIVFCKYRNNKVKEYQL